MRTFLVFLLGIITVLASFAAFIFIIATGKEGVAPSDLKYFGILLALLFAFMGIWLFIIKQSQSSLYKMLGTLAIGTLCIPFLIAVLVAGFVLRTAYQAKTMANNAVLSDYKEQLITWPTLPYPVGLKVELTVNNATTQGRYGDIVFWMGPDNLITFYTLLGLSPVKTAFLKPFIFNREEMFAKDPREGNNLKIVRNLLPSSIEVVKSPNVICKKEYGQTVVDSFYIDKHINGVLFWHKDSSTAEINVPLRNLIRQHSQLENNPELWTKMHQQFEDEALLANGFRKCVIEQHKNCYCKSI